MELEEVIKALEEIIAKLRGKTETPRGCRLPDGWTLGPIGLNYATSKGLSEEAANLEAEKFKAYWLSVSGKNAIKRDWLQAWQVWVLGSLQKYGVKPTTKPKMSQEEIEERIRRYHEQEEAKRKRLGLT